MADKKGYSTNGDEYNHRTQHDALAELYDSGDLIVGRTYYEIQIEDVRLTRYMSAMSILDMAQDQISDEVGEAAEDAFDVSSLAVAELDAAISLWVEKNLAGTHFWRCVGKPTELQVTDSDAADFTA